ncbi:hypothetical protein [Pedobacter sp. BMA]|uniref:hypothetical protein n=1 Tax=Pedobacter sp. BMA TaxID=1663685 RepID=UPI00064A55F7|nr:hypothetical protein [Pedobacter sp. BMA]KLT64880.1 hypothetical protein AB669_14210 [Pedobacter sp. BMA]
MSVNTDFQSVNANLKPNYEKRMNIGLSTLNDQALHNIKCPFTIYGRNSENVTGRVFNTFFEVY